MKKLKLGIHFIVCSQTEGHCAVFFLFLKVSSCLDSVLHSQMLEQKLGKKKKKKKDKL